MNTGERSRLSSGVNVDMILAAYRQGLFPMAEGKTGRIGFYYYEPRAIVPLDERFKVRKSLRQIINRQEYEIKFDAAFDQVIRACARHDLPRWEIWLSHEMIKLYEELHAMGVAHSVEVWTKGEDSKLVGGLYGLHMGSAFFGESKFSAVPYASQLALVALVEHLRKREFTLLDAQMPSDHLKQFGMIELSQNEYLQLLGPALSLERGF